MGGFAFYGSDMDRIPTVKESLTDLSTNPRFVAEVPNFETLTYIMEHFPQIITDTNEETILDRAESSSLSKAVLIVQVAWFCTNCASRLIQRLPLSLLEVSAAAHGFCTLLTYLVWWSKPTNVATPTIMRGEKAREVYALLKCSDEEYEEALKMALEMAQKGAAGDSSRPTGREKIILAANTLQHLLPNPQRPPGDDHYRFFGHRPNMIPGAFDRGSASNAVYELIAVAVSPALYGLIHFLAWNDRFPTPLERALWRASSVVVSCTGIIAIVEVAGIVWIVWITRFAWGSRSRMGLAKTWRTAGIGVGAERIVRFARLPFVVRLFPSNSFGAIFNYLIGFIFSLIPTAHVVSSGFLIVESFRQLFFLEPAAYQLPSWTNYWPHLS